MKNYIVIGRFPKENRYCTALYRAKNLRTLRARLKRERVTDYTIE